MESNFDYLFVILFVFVAVSITVKMLKHGGFKGAMFGAGIHKTIGEVAGSGPGFGSLSLKIHKLDKPPEKSVGIELASKSLTSYQMIPITLSIAEVKQLTVLLDRAIGRKHDT